MTKRELAGHELGPLAFKPYQFRSALRRHQGWLVARRSDLAAARRVRAVLIAYAAIVAVRTGYLIAEAVIAPLSYFDMFGFYVVLAVVGNYLAIEGWRQADARPQPIVEPIERDWGPIAAGWIDRIKAHEWWRDPDLDLAELARRLGTNTAYLSRGFNEGLKLSFTGVINGLRLEHVAARLRDGADGDILMLAIDAGFGSKATFNRAFKERFGVTPSAYRRVSTDKNDAAHRDLQRTA